MSSSFCKRGDEQDRLAPVAWDTMPCTPSPTCQSGDDSQHNLHEERPMNLVRFMLAGAAVAGLAGCFSAMDSFRNYGMPRASFEMHCPTEQLKVTVLLETPAGVGSQVGGEGCEKRTVYVLVSGAGWVVD